MLFEIFDSVVLSPRTHAHTYTHASKQSSIQERTHTHTHTHSYIYVCVCVCVHVCVSVYVRMYSCRKYNLNLWFITTKQWYIFRFKVNRKVLLSTLHLLTNPKFVCLFVIIPRCQTSDILWVVHTIVAFGSLLFIISRFIYFNYIDWNILGLWNKSLSSYLSYNSLRKRDNWS